MYVLLYMLNNLIKTTPGMDTLPLSMVYPASQSLRFYMRVERIHGTYELDAETEELVLRGMVSLSFRCLDHPGPTRRMVAPMTVRLSRLELE